MALEESFARRSSVRRLQLFARHLRVGAAVHSCAGRPAAASSAAAAARPPMADGPAVRERIRELLDGGADTPLRVDAAGAPDPAHLARLRAAMDAAAAAGDFRLATGLQDFLFAGVAHWFPRHSPYKPNHPGCRCALQWSPSHRSP